MNYEKQIAELLKASNGMLTAKQLRELNIPTVYLSRMEKKGELKRVAPGMYLSSAGDYDELYIFQSRYAKTVFSYETALYLLGGTDKILQGMDVTVIYNYKFNRKAPNVRVHYVKEDIWPLGVIERKTMYGNTVKTYSFERTICDMISNRNKVDTETYVSAIRRYANHQQADLNTLYIIANRMGIVEQVREVMEVACA